MPSLYSTPPNQDVSSTNSTSLYGGAGTPIPDSTGNLVVRGDLIVQSGNILTTATTGNIFPTNATTINLGNAATAINIGANTGTTTVNNDLTVDGDLTINGTFIAPGAEFGNITIAVATDNTITTTTGALILESATGEIDTGSSTNISTNSSTFNLLNFPTTVNAFLNATSLFLGENGVGTTDIRNDLTVRGDLRINGNDIKSSGGSTAITLSGTNVTVAGDLQVTGNDIKSSSGSNAITLSGTDVTVIGDLTVTGNDIKGSGGTTAITMSAGSVTIADDLTVTGDAINLAQSTDFLYSENNNRLNRPNVRSTTGNTSGFRVEAPNATASGTAITAVFSTNDPNNGKFINIRADGSAGPLSIRTGQYVAGVFGASGNSIDIYDGSTKYATINPAGPTVGTDLTTKTYVDAHPGTTYTIDATSTTGGANLNLNGSDLTTDSVAFKGSGSTTVTRTDANTITVSSTDTNTTYDFNATSTTGGVNLNLVGSDLTTDTVKIANGTGVTASYVSGTEVSVAIGQPVATTDAVTFASVSANGVNVGLTANTISGAPLALASNTAGGGQITATLTDSMPGNDTGVLTMNPTALSWAHTGVLPGSVTGTWSWNANGTTSFPNYTFPYADGTINQVLRTNGAGVLSWYTPVDTNTTYTIDASSTTGGANLNLVGSDSTTDTVKFASGTGVTVSQTNANEMSIAIGQAVGTGNSPTFAGATLGNIAVGVATSNTISSTNTNGDILITPNGTGDVDLVADTVQIGDANATATLTTNGTGDLVLNTNNGTNAGSVTLAQGTNGNITVAPNGTGNLVVTTATDTNITDGNYILGNISATRNTAWIAPTSGLTTLSSTNGVAAASSTGYGASFQAVYYSGDTTAGVNSSAGFIGRGASGTNSVPGAAANNQTLVTVTADGYATTGFAQNIATVNSGGGTTAIAPAQIQLYARENFADNGTTVTNAGVGFRVRGFPTGVSMSVANRVNYIDHSPNSATYRSDAFVFQQGTTTTSTTNFRSNTWNIQNSGGTTTYAQFAASGHTIGNVDSPTTFIRTSGATAGIRPVSFQRNTQTVTAAPANNDGASFRFQTAGSNATVYNLAELAGFYGATGDSGVQIGVANGDQTTATMTQVVPFTTKLSGTTIKATATPSATPGANTLTDVAIFTPATTTIRSNALTLQNSAGSALTSAGVNYTRTYGEFAYTNAAGFTIPAQNTIYAMPLDTTNASSGTSTSNTSRINITVSGWYKIIISLQSTLTVSNQPGQFDFWLRKNGNDVANSKTQVDLLKDQKSVIAMDWLVNSNGSDYWEIVYVGTTANFANIAFPTIAATTTPYVSPLAPALIVNVIPAGM